MSESKPLNLKVEALGGLSAGIVGTVIGYPLDLVKTRMQTTSQGVGIFRVGRTILKEEGILALYKGMTPPLISLAILNTATFTSYNYIRTQIGAERGWDLRNGAAGMVGAPMGSLISTVEHMLKTQMQLDNITDKRYTGSLHCIRTLVKERGWKILYTGHAVNTVREGVFLGTYFYTYEGLKLFLNNNVAKRGGYTEESGMASAAWTVPVAGGISGAWAWFISFPLDCIKAGIQGQRLPELNMNGDVIGATKKLGAMDVLRDLLETKGWRGLYSGVTPSIMRAFIVSGSRFSAYELAVNLFGEYLR